MKRRIANSFLLVGTGLLILSMLLSAVSFAAPPAAPLAQPENCTAGDIEATAISTSGCQVCEPGEVIYIDIMVTIDNQNNSRRVFEIQYDADGDGTRETADYVGCIDGRTSQDFALSTPVAVECGQEFYLNAKIQANLTPPAKPCPTEVEPHPSQCRFFDIPVDTLTMIVPDIEVCEGTSVTEAMLLDAGASCSSGTPTFDLSGVDTSLPGTTQYWMSCADSAGCQDIEEPGDVTVPDCDDQDECTIDTCSEGPPWDIATCVNTEVICDYLGDAQCGAQGVCNSTTGLCEYDYPVLSTTCEADADLCTIDHCDGAGACVFKEDVTCDDGLFCTDEYCDPAEGCIYTDHDCDDDNICTDDSCDEAANICVNVFDVTNDPSCELCYGVVCDDENACTTDACDPATGECVFTPITCDDEDACTTDSCDPDTGCVYTPIDCDDAKYCTLDSCDPAIGCVYAPRDCSDDLFCTINEVCDEVIGACMSDPRDCSDDLFCTINETCDETANACVSDPRDCDDADICTDDSCDEAADTCVNVFDATNDPSCAVAPVLSANTGMACSSWWANFSSNVTTEYYVKVFLDGNPVFEEGGFFSGTKSFQEYWYLWGTGDRTMRMIYWVKAGEHQVGDDETRTRDCGAPPPPPPPPPPTPTPTPIVEVLAVERLPVTGGMAALPAFPSLALTLSSLALISGGLLLRRKE